MGLETFNIFDPSTSRLELLDLSEGIDIDMNPCNLTPSLNMQSEGNIFSLTRATGTSYKFYVKKPFLMPIKKVAL